MKMKLSITLSKETVRAVDKVVGKHGNRSAFIEYALHEALAQGARRARDAKDLAIYTKYADEYNALIQEDLELIAAWVAADKAKRRKP
jgi:Arc/MetJ-type ribon-helix-helix transcriptional regulator